MGPCERPHAKYNTKEEVRKDWNLGVGCPITSVTELLSRIPEHLNHNNVHARLRTMTLQSIHAHAIIMFNSTASDD